jgi:hypothetical protein
VDAWSNCETDDDANWARREFEGLNAHQADELFSQNVLGAAESIGFMPREAFKYYISALARYVANIDFDSAENAASAADCLFGCLESRAKVDQQAVMDLMPIVKPVLMNLANNQKRNDMPVEIYGNLKLRALKLF